MYGLCLVHSLCPGRVYMLNIAGQLDASQQRLQRLKQPALDQACLSVAAASVVHWCVALYVLYCYICQWV